MCALRVKDAGPIPAQIVGYLSVRPQDGRSVLTEDDLSDFRSFYGSDENFKRTEAKFRELGFEELARSPFGYAIGGPPEAWEQLNQRKVVTFEELLYGRFGEQKSVTHVGVEGPEGPDQPVTASIPDDGAATGIDAIVFERPRAALDVAVPAAAPPSVNRFHLRVPEDVARLLGADSVHAAGHRGDGVRVAMIDSGFYRHPFFVERGYQVEETLTVVPDTDAAVDPYGHGTGEAANVFAVAPGARLLPIRAADDGGHLVGTLAGFMQAKQKKVQVITCSWSGDYPYPLPPQLPHPADRMLELEIRDAIFGDGKIVVVFAAGNGTYGMEAQVPGVIAAGGVYADASGQLSATPYATGYQSRWFRRGLEPITVPTVSGLVGLPPRAAYLMLPVPPGGQIDRERAGGTPGDPPDGTTPTDGWALFSGTSAAAPQIAGAAAVLRELHPTAAPEAIAERLCASATDVRDGASHPRFGHAAGVGPDLASGHGLINLERAVANWPPAKPPVRREVPVKASDAPSLLEALEQQNLLDRFLELIAWDDAFRKLLQDEPDTALQRITLKEPYQKRPIKLAPKSKCQQVLSAHRAGEPFEVVDPSGQIVNMLG